MITEEQIQAVVRRIVEGCAPDRIILFGSYAYSEPTEHSDLDLLVVKSGLGLLVKSGHWLCGGWCAVPVFQWIFWFVRPPR